MTELITMTSKELSRYETIKRLIRKEVNGTEAALQLSLSVRQIRNLKGKVKKYGERGIIHRNRGRPSNNRMPEKRIKKMEEIVKKKYPDFGPTFAAEKLEEDHKIKVSSEKLRLLMVDWKLWKPKPRKKNKEHRNWRPRKEYYGQMEQFDGSYHKWFEERASECCLLASIDDATGKITGARLVHDEGTIPVFIFWQEYLEKQGKPVSIYLDRLSTYKKNHKSVFDDPECLTQFERAMKEDLNIKVIHANSPQARGRAERLFGTLQDRLVKELRLAKISTIEEANKFLEEIFIPKFNSKFARVPQKRKDLHRKLNRREKESLDKIFSVHSTRVVNNDFTIRFKGKWYQLLEKQPTLVRRKERVQIEERIDKSLFISLRDKYLEYILLPARPKRIELKVPALTRTKSTWKPPTNHPWRRSFFVSKRNIKQPVSVH